MGWRLCIRRVTPGAKLDAAPRPNAKIRDCSAKSEAVLCQVGLSRERQRKYHRWPGVLRDAILVAANCISIFY